LSFANHLSFLPFTKFNLLSYEDNVFDFNDDFLVTA
jgi:hypothetical protein